MSEDASEFYLAQIKQRGAGVLSREFRDLLRAMAWVRHRKAAMGDRYRRARVVSPDGRVVYRDRGRTLQEGGER